MGNRERGDCVDKVNVHLPVLATGKGYPGQPVSSPSPADGPNRIFSVVRVFLPAGTPPSGVCPPAKET